MLNVDNFVVEDEDEDFDATHKCEIATVLKPLGSRLEDLNTCNDLITKHGTGLQRALSELESLDATTTQELPKDLSTKIRSINEKATLFRITSNAMINVQYKLVLFLPKSRYKFWDSVFIY